MSQEWSKSESTSMSEDCRHLGQSLLAAKREFTATGKNSKTNQYSYAKIEDIYAAVEPALHDNNIIIVWCTCWHAIIF